MIIGMEDEEEEEEDEEDDEEEDEADSLSVLRPQDVSLSDPAVCWLLYIGREC